MSRRAFRDDDKAPDSAPLWLLCYAALSAYWPQVLAVLGFAASICYWVFTFSNLD